MLRRTCHAKETFPGAGKLVDHGSGNGLDLISHPYYKTSVIFYQCPQSNSFPRSTDPAICSQIPLTTKQGQKQYAQKYSFKIGDQAVLSMSEQRLAPECSAKAARVNLHHSHTLLTFAMVVGLPFFYYYLLVYLLLVLFIGIFIIGFMFFPPRQRSQKTHVKNRYYLTPVYELWYLHVTPMTLFMAQNSLPPESY